ncbi:MAG: hypothetical protein HZA14_09980 [Nitrospirae bacterium]|nr:hypothetical protein [Nitrospirota bacterium]
MYKTILIKLTGITGLLLVLSAYYLLWIPPETGLSEVMTRTRYAIVLNLSGGLMVVYSIYRR